VGILQLGKGLSWFLDAAAKQGEAAVGGCSAGRRNAVLRSFARVVLQDSPRVAIAQSPRIFVERLQCVVITLNCVLPGSIDSPARPQAISAISQRETDMYTERCPLCYAFTRSGAVEHLVRDHRRTYAEACVLFEHSKAGTLGWNALAAPAKVSPPYATADTSRRRWLPVP
jgi:hypothetical protein